MRKTIPTFLLLFGFCLPHSGFAQASGYSREAIAARERGAAEGRQGPEGVLPVRRQPTLERDMLMSGARSIANMRTGARGREGGQSAMLRYYQHREVSPPDYATIRIGPWYTDLGVSQSVGYRYVRLEGSGVDFITGNDRGEIRDDGSDFPLISTLTLNNYLIVSRHMDLEANVRISYEHYPMETQEDELDIDLTDEGVYATFSSEYHPWRDIRLLVYDDILYRTDYVDTRGLSDRYGGREYEHFQNTLGADMDWKPTSFDNIGISASRADTIPLGDDEFDDQERVQYLEVASYQHRLTPFATAGLLGNASQSLYKDDTRSDIYMYGLNAFTASRLTRRLTGNASLGYQVSTYEGNVRGGSDRGSVSGRLGLGHTISEQKSQRVTYERTMTEAFRGGVDVRDRLAYNFRWQGGLFPGNLRSQYSIYDPQDSDRNGYSDWDTRLSLKHRLTRLMSLTFATGYSVRMNDVGDADTDTDRDIDDTEEAADTVVATPDIDSDYETFTVRLGTGMRLTQKTRLHAYAEHADRTSDNADLAYTRDIVAATVTWTHKF